MSFPKACPHCDAGLGQYVNRYLCGTYLRPGVDTHKHQTKLCIVRELAAANARIRRLEAVLENVINSAKPNQAEHPSMWNAWFKARLVMEAKEAKP